MITGRALPWTRYWVKREEAYALTDEGFLVDPEGPYGASLNAAVKTFEHLDVKPCVILLGEVGMGKSIAITEVADHTRRAVAGTSAQIVYKSLSAVSGEYTLVEDVFRSREMFEWENGSHRLHLFVDALDEGIARVDAIAGVIESQLSRAQQHLSRLHLRVVCRTADWPLSLESALRRLYGSDNVGVYELCPLREVDIQLAARESGVDSERFVQAVEERGVGAFASRPITLELLLEQFRRGGGVLPTSQIQLYREGCERLCGEVNPSRLTPGVIGSLTPKQRLAVASRIGATMLLCNRSIIALHADSASRQSDQLLLDDLVGGQEQIDGRAFDVSRASVMETLATGLFSSRGAGLLGWAHKSYAEFLAAVFLAEHHLPEEQVRSLALTSVTGEFRAIPQVREVVGWLASMSERLFDQLLASDPEVLLLSDVQTTSVEKRTTLLERLMRALKEGVAHDRDRTLRRSYRKLKSPRLADTLRPLLVDRSEVPLARSVAIDIAETCSERGVQRELVEIALTQSEPLSLRVNAAYAIVRMGDAAHRAALKPLVRSGPEDVHDQLKGCGLSAIWPDHLSFNELTEVLSAPRRQSFVGAYQVFLSSTLAERLRPEDLRQALEWIQAQEVLPERSYVLVKVMDGIVAKAWDHLDQDGVRRALAQYVVGRAAEHDSLLHEDHPEFSNRRQVQDDRRHALLLEAVALMDGDENVAWALSHHTGRIVFPKDSEWLCERAQEETTDARRRLWANLISAVADFTAPPIRARLQELMAHPIYADAFQATLKATAAQQTSEVQAASPTVRSLRSRDETAARTERIRREIEGFLPVAAAGDTTGWWRLNYVLSVDPATGDANEHLSDLTSMPGWSAIAGVRLEECLAAAKHFLRRGDPENHAWIGTNTIFRPAMAGYRALRLLHDHEPRELDEVTPNQWAKWAGIILGFSVESGAPNEVVRHNLIRRAYSRAPQAVLDALRDLILGENKRFENVHVHRWMEGIWDDAVARTILDTVKGKVLKETCWRDLLRSLLEHGDSDARAYAIGLVQRPGRRGRETALRRTVAAALLIVHTDGDWWATVWPAVKSNASFGRLVFEQVTDRLDSRNSYKAWASELSEAQLGELYIWLDKNVPRESEGVEDSVGWGRRSGFEMRLLRDGVMNVLQSSGTQQACDVIRLIIQALPDRKWLQETLVDAMEAMRRKAWSPIEPAHLLAMVCDAERRLVRNGEELLEVISESLGRLEKHLQGETPAAIDLWNEMPRGGYFPKDENRLSDYIKRHLVLDLKQRGIVLGREVEIRRSSGGARGQRTDIYVGAVRSDDAGRPCDVISAIVEVKGCWHSEVFTALRTQLVNRYLRDARTGYGIYLVGWYKCDSWASSDARRRGRARQIRRGLLRAQLARQATQASTEGRSVRARVLDVSLT